MQYEDYLEQFAQTTVCFDTRPRQEVQMCDRGKITLPEEDWKYYYQMQSLPNSTTI